MQSDSFKSGSSQPAPSFLDNTNAPQYDITYDLPSTKFLGTLRTMASASPSPAENRPLSPNIVHRPETPPSRVSSGSSHDGDGSPKVFARFTLNFVAVLRVFAIVFSIILVAVEFHGRIWQNGQANFFISFAIIQLVWLIFALLTQCYWRRTGQKKGFTIDLGFVKCIFGRRGYHDDGYEVGGVPGWMGDDGGKQSNMNGLIYTAVDITFAAITFTAGVIAAGHPYYWHSGVHVAIAVFALFVGVLEAVIALAQQFVILTRAKVQIMWDQDDEDDLGSQKYRIRLPQSPEQRHAPMSVAA